MVLGKCGNAAGLSNGRNIQLIVVPENQAVSAPIKAFQRRSGHKTTADSDFRSPLTKELFTQKYMLYDNSPSSEAGCVRGAYIGDWQSLTYILSIISTFDYAYSQVLPHWILAHRILPSPIQPIRVPLYSAEIRHHQCGSADLAR